MNAFYTQWSQHKGQSKQRDLMERLHKNRLIDIISHLGYGKVFECYGECDHEFCLLIEKFAPEKAIQYKQEQKKLKDTKRDKVYAVIARRSELSKAVLKVFDPSGLLSQQNLRNAFKQLGQPADPGIKCQLYRLAEKIPDDNDDDQFQLAALWAIETGMALGADYMKAVINRLPRALSHAFRYSTSAEKSAKKKNSIKLPSGGFWMRCVRICR